ncbi:MULTISPECIES: ABC transporter substrate-binding protein [Kribbella]|uniref:Extracellular solute-binding protein n=1 Tax=Kribbella karoonensis TaxID=324851 RepID=A0ABN2DXC9_9ACTN
MADMSRRNFLRSAGMLAGSVAAAPLVAGCGDGGKSKATQSGAVKLDFWTHDPGYVKTYTASAKAANAAKTYPFTFSLGVTSLAADAVVTKLIAQAQAKKGTPDIAGLEVSQFPRMMKQNIAPSVLVDWSSELNDEQKSDLLRLADYTVDGKAYALESDTCPTVLYYRPDLFKKYGIPEDVGSWEELQAAAKGALAAGKALGICCNGEPGAALGTFRQLYQQRGLNLFDESGKPTIDTPEAVAVIKFMADSLKSGFFTMVPDPYGAPNAAALKSEKLIATFMPNWYNVYGLQANVPKQKGLWRVRTLPKFSAGGGVGAALGGTGFAVVKDKPNTQAAIDLVKYTYLTKAGQLLRFKTAGYLPTMKSLYDAPEFNTYTDAYLGGQKVFPIYKEIAAQAPPFHQSADATTLIDALGGAIQKAQTGAISADQAVKDAMAQYESQTK